MNIEQTGVDEHGFPIFMVKVSSVKQIVDLDERTIKKRISSIVDINNGEFDFKIFLLKVLDLLLVDKRLKTNKRQHKGPLSYDSDPEENVDVDLYELGGAVHSEDPLKFKIYLEGLEKYTKIQEHYGDLIRTKQVGDFLAGFFGYLCCLINDIEQDILRAVEKKEIPPEFIPVARKFVLDTYAYLRVTAKKYVRDFVNNNVNSDVYRYSSIWQEEDNDLPKDEEGTDDMFVNSLANSDVTDELFADKPSKDD